VLSLRPDLGEILERPRELFDGIERDEQVLGVLGATPQLGATLQPGDAAWMSKIFEPVRRVALSRGL